MGAVTFSIDLELVETLKQALPLTHFVETGTFEGKTVEQVNSLFDEVHSIELAEEYYLKSLERFKSFPNVKLHLGRSEEVLRSLHPRLEAESVLYWLDAHWCSASHTAGETSQCPILQELDAIQHLNSESVLLIDDARLFLCPPPKPHEISQWPNFNQIVRKLFSLNDQHEVMVLNDVVLFYPSSIQEIVQQFAHLTAIDWLSVLDKSRDYDALLTQLKQKENLLQEKEMQIHLLASVAHERETALQQKETVINNLAFALDQMRTTVKD